MYQKLSNLNTSRKIERNNNTFLTYSHCNNICTGWLGFVMLATFAVATAYSSTCLGTCWLILEERALENRHFPIQDPYSTIAFHSFGKVVR